MTDLPTPPGVPVWPAPLAPFAWLPVIVVLAGLAIGPLAAKLIDLLSQPRGVSFVASAANQWGSSSVVAARRRATPLRPVALGGATALGWLLAYHRFGLSWHGALGAAVWFFLILVTLVDLRTHLIPDPLLVWGAIIIVPLAWITGVTPWRQGLIGFVACGGFLLLMAVVGRGNMGGGDVKLAALIGLVLGWPLGGLALLLGFMAGAAAGLVFILLKFLRRDGFMAFGPYIALGTVIVLFWGEIILVRYF